MLPRERASCPNCRASVVFAAGAKRVTCRACDCVLGRREKRVKRNPSTSEQVQRAKSDYRAFHETEPELHKVKLPAPPKALMLMGELKSFVYQPPAKSSRGEADDGKPIQWSHESGDVGLGPLRIGKAPMLYTTPDHKQLHILGGTGHFDEGRGWVG